MEKQHSKDCFNYCKWAKTIIAIPVLPLIALIAASFFSEFWLQVIAGAGAVMITIYAAIWIDRIPLLTKKIRKHK